ncbi:MAG: DNA-3-methyladenine glycosylase [Acidobacteriota bacterium]
MGTRKLPRSFYDRSALLVAPDLLGKILCHRRGGLLTSGRIVEVEAYLGEGDPASHAFRGPSRRNRAMFGPPGHAYVYFTYGNHFCMNVVTGPDGVASAVLIRALEPVEGIAAMRRRRGRTRIEDLTSGPGKLAQALGIDRDAYGLDLRREPLWICTDGLVPSGCATGPRVGIRAATDRPYRFFLPDSPFVSRPHGARRPRAGGRVTSRRAGPRAHR